MDPSTSGRRPSKKRSSRPPTTFNALSYDILCLIFASLDLFDLVRCSAVCKSWDAAMNKSKLLQVLYCKQQQRKSTGLFDTATFSERSLKIHLEELAMDQHKFSLQQGLIDVDQWRGHSVRVDQCRMKMGLILTGVGDKVMRLWSAESYNCLDEYFLPDKAPLIDYDFDESKVVGLVGTRICIWRRNGKRNIFSSREGLFTKGLCMRYVDPEAVVGCEDGTARVFDMYSRKCSQIIKMHAGPVTCLSFGNDQLIVSGSSLGSITISGLSSDQRVASLRSTDIGGIRTLCFNPSSHLLFAGSTAGYASCWDLRTMRTLWITRASPNVLYSMHHLRNDKSTLVVGGIDGVLRILDQDTGEVFSRCIMDESSRLSNSSKDVVIERKKARRLSEDTRIDLITKTCRPPIRCLAVGMQKVVTTHNDKYIRMWKFSK
ncbi:hypothetical protein F0562_018764 [Nyssa sinensis]|uniref:F-box domain-containing protein n=1 Tax=Nyssa sinensis TaxID=561372 RepID=A0A5J4ZAI9_9ASTE|nr:hypothetical protein F0562_018764 [Nyssa sinensis]